MSDKRYRVTYNGAEVVRLGGSKFMAGTVAFVDEEAAREAAGLGDFTVEGLDAAGASAPVANATPPTAVASQGKAGESKPAVAKADESKPAPAKAEEKKAEAKPAEEKKPAEAAKA